METSESNNEQSQLMAQETDLDDEIDDNDIENEEEEEGLEPFDPTKIRVKTKIMTLDLILNRIKHEEIDLAPDSQRNANIWTTKAKSRLID